LFRHSSFEFLISHRIRCGVRHSNFVIRISLLAGAFLFAGCSSLSHPNLSTIHANWVGPTTQSLSLPFYDDDVAAVVDPPAGWKPDPLKSSSSHTHKVWLSPTGLTAYGVIHFKMPLPLGQNLALGGFLDQMKRTEGVVNLISRQDDPNLPGIRFVAEGGRYYIRTNFIVDGWQGWAIYAGTLRNNPNIADELDMAIRARDHTKVGRPDNTGK
jgi:hypothetical protein